jgi:hypothetical protein
VSAVTATFACSLMAGTLVSPLRHVNRAAAVASHPTTREREPQVPPTSPRGEFGPEDR